MFCRVTGFAPRMFGPTIIGYGSYAYTYASGHSGVACATGFSPRKAALTLYGVGTYLDWQGMAEKLGKHEMGKSCLYIRKLSDIDMDVLEAMVAKGLQNLASHWPVTPT
jgi:hypothetical protein